jgi:hypothetical protein
MTIKREEEFERVGVKHLNGRIKQRYGEQATIRTVLDRQNVIRHLERLRMRHRQHPRCRSILDLARDLADLKVPKLDVFVGATSHEASSVRSNMQGPDGTSVRGEGFEEG